MDKNNEKGIIYLQDKIKFLERKKQVLENELRYSMLDVKKLCDANKRVNKSKAVLVVIVGMVSASFIINGSFLAGFLTLFCTGIFGLSKFYQQDKTNKYIRNAIENNKKIILELENICDDIDEYNLKLKKLKNNDNNNEEISITRDVLKEYVTKKEELSHEKVKKIGGKYGNNI